MIFDFLNNLSQYKVPHTETILEFISKNDCASLPIGQIDILGKNLFVKVMEYEPKAATENRFETHTVHADLQYIVSGVELMQIVPAQSLISLTEYDKEGDYQFFAAQEMITDIAIEAGQFTVFYPGEAHKPSCIYQNNKNKVKKLVFKIRMK